MSKKNTDESRDSENFVNAVGKDKNSLAMRKLENLLKKKIAKRISNTLSK